MSDDRIEACGRCGLSSVVDTTDGADRDVFDGGRIEVSESEARATGRHVELLGRVKRRLDSFGNRLVYGNSPSK
jgi:hypothetical protein